MTHRARISAEVDSNKAGCVWCKVAWVIKVADFPYTVESKDFGVVGICPICREYRDVGSAISRLSAGLKLSRGNGDYEWLVDDVYKGSRTYGRTVMEALTTGVEHLRTTRYDCLGRCGVSSYEGPFLCNSCKTDLESFRKKRWEER